jgi:hypothetical protein
MVISACILQYYLIVLSRELTSTKAYSGSSKSFYSTECAITVIQVTTQTLALLK